LLFYFSNLKPIENLWSILYSHIREKKHQQKGRKEPIVILQDNWKKLNIEIVNNLVNDMPRMQAVIDAKGGWTDYWSDYAALI